MDCSTLFVNAILFDVKTVAIAVPKVMESKPVKVVKKTGILLGSHCRWVCGFARQMIQGKRKAFWRGSLLQLQDFAVRKQASIELPEPVQTTGLR